MEPRPKCPVAELERQILAAMHVEDAAERAGQKMEAAAAKAIVCELLEEQLSAISRSEHGVVLQLIARFRAVDEGDTATAERLDRIIRQGVDTIALALGARLTAPEQNANA